MVKQQVCRWIIASAKFLRLDHFIPDKLYLRLLYRRVFNEKLNLDNPQKFNEKLFWLKLYDRRPEYTMMVDKYAVKQYVSKKIGEEYVIPTLGVWEKPEDIDWEKLPDQFVLKCTHDSGGLVICRNKETLDKESAKEVLRSCLKRNYYWAGREWPYKNVPPRIIAEKYMEVRPGMKDLPDYKWYCFNGEPTYCQVINSRSENETIDFFDTSWNHQEFIGLNPAKNSTHVPEKPQDLDKQIIIARKLSENIPFSRVDLYSIDQHTWFGEITLYPAGGTGKFTPDTFNLTIGKLLKLPGEKWLGGGVIISVLHNGEIKISQPDLPDYKFFCFGGVVKAMFIGTERSTGDVKFDYFDADFNHLDLVQEHPMSGKDFSIPENFDKMKELASKLSQGIPHVRVDLYNINGCIYFGEMTFYHHGGVIPFHPESWDYTFGSWINLPNKTK